MDNLSAALSAIADDGIICYPTEGVWGLGCHPHSSRAFARLLALKQREADKGVILLAANMAQIQPFAQLDEQLTQAVKAVNQDEAFVTCVLPKARTCPDYLSGQFDSVAIRLTHYLPLRALCLRAGTALVSTSANISGCPPVQTLEEARATFADSVDAYVDGALGGQNRPSRIVAWEKGEMKVLRY